VRTSDLVTATLSAGGLDASGGAIGTTGSLLRLNVPQTVPGAGGAAVPSVLLLQSQSATDATVAAQTNQIATVGDIQISAATFDPGTQNVDSFLTTTFSTRTALAQGILVENVDFFGQSGSQGGGAGALAALTLATANATAVSANAGAASAQGEGTLIIDWASFNPNVSLFGTVNPPICLPSDQSEEDPEPDDAAAGAASGGCASTTAQYDGSFRLPVVRLVITGHGAQWVTRRSEGVSAYPLISQLR
jgi:hypothetical protein